MLHDITILVYGAGGGNERHVVQVDAAGGDDAAEKGAVEAVGLAGGRSWQIVGIGPAAEPKRDYMAPDAVTEGDDLQVPDEMEPAKRGPGRPRKEHA